ncbi:type II secretion system F family protein [Streptosporangiaceae bacterium NEAU-GS5]|nr:type II secretion system F family protein [Streptosporangiaceae bacterium NEAU-GS5]
MAVLAAVLVAGAILTWPKHTTSTDRLKQLLLRTSVVEPTEPWPVAQEDHPHSRSRQLLIGGAVGLMSQIVIGGTAGVVVGALLAIAASTIVMRREPPAVRRRRDKTTADLPFAVDLMVACLRAGQPIGSALDAAAHGVAGPLGERLAWVGGQIRLGAAPQAAWATLAGERSLAPLSRTMTRAVLSGAPVAEALVRLADDARQEARATASAAARRVGVQVVAPLGLCFLPAFVLLGIVPVVAGLMSQIVLP